MISLVVSTKGRKAPIAKLLASLEAQTLRAFELIVVEQNDERLLDDILGRDWSFPVTYLHTPGEQGLSRGRNRGLAEARGEFVLFPDDDCWYPADLLERAVARMKSERLDALTGRSTDEAGNPINGRFEKSAQWIRRENVWTTQIEWIAFWRRDMLRKIDGYDEMIGIGAKSPWQSAEGQDLMLRALRANARCWYDPHLNGHDNGLDRQQASPDIIARARRYGRGMGFVMRKHKLGLATPAYFVSRSLAGATLAFLTGKRSLGKFHAYTALGRLEGLSGRFLPWGG